MGWLGDAKRAALNMPWEVPLGPFAQVGRGVMHVAGIPGRAVTAAGTAMSGIPQQHSGGGVRAGGMRPMGVKDVIDYAFLGDDASVKGLSGYGDLLQDVIEQEGGPKLAGQIAGLAGNAISDPALLAAGVPAAREGIRAAAIKASEGPWVPMNPRPFPRRLSALERSDTALGGHQVGRVSQSSVQSQAEALYERGVALAEGEGAKRVGPYVHDAAAEFPTFTQRGLDRARQMVLRGTKQQRLTTGPVMWEKPAEMEEMKKWLSALSRVSPDATMPPYDPSRTLPLR